MIRAIVFIALGAALAFGASYATEMNAHEMLAAVMALAGATGAATLG